MFVSNLAMNNSTKEGTRRGIASDSEHYASRRDVEDAMSEEIQEKKKQDRCGEIVENWQ